MRRRRASLRTALLLEFGARADEVDHLGRTALHVACKHGRVECARRIVAKLGLGVRQLLPRTDSNGFTPVQLARVAMEGDGAACIELLSAAAATGTHA